MPSLNAQMALFLLILTNLRARGQIVDSCPYGAIWWNEEKDIPQHWNFDAHLIDEGWTAPRADKVCATEAIKAVKVEPSEMAKMIQEHGFVEKNSPLSMGPNLGSGTKISTVTEIVSSPEASRRRTMVSLIVFRGLLSTKTQR